MITENRVFIFATIATSTCCPFYFIAFDSACFYKAYSLIRSSVLILHLKDIESLTLENGKVVTPAEPIDWYPDGLAWKTNLSRTEVRKFPQLAGFHQWMVAEAEAGHITRQELVSMIPTLLLDVKSHHAVLDMCAAPGSKTSQIIEALHVDAAEGEVPKGFCVANDANNARCYMLVHQVKKSSVRGRSAQRLAVYC